eukprot:scaffold477_cov355-Pinguiococcus_pyrenoidosus.AAC.8
MGNENAEARKQNSKAEEETKKAVSGARLEFLGLASLAYLARAPVGRAELGCDDAPLPPARAEQLQQLRVFLLGELRLVEVRADVVEPSGARAES